MNKLNIYETGLTHGQIDILRELIGQRVFKLYSPAIEIEDNIVTASSISLNIGDRWIVFQCSWLQTENDSSYYQLSIERAEGPYGIRYDKATGTIFHPVSALLFNRSQNNDVVGQINIYSSVERLGNEELRYDHTILLITVGGFRVSIGVKEDITDRLECTIDNEIIDNLLLKSTLSHSIH
jgi:hypothetical protein